MVLACFPSLNFKKVLLLFQRVFLLKSGWFPWNVFLVCLHGGPVSPAACVVLRTTQVFIHEPLERVCLTEARLQAGRALSISVGIVKGLGHPGTARRVNRHNSV